MSCIEPYTWQNQALKQAGGRQADEMQVRLKIFKACYESTFVFYLAKV